MAIPGSTLLILVCMVKKNLLHGKIEGIDMASYCSVAQKHELFLNSLPLGFSLGFVVFSFLQKPTLLDGSIFLGSDQSRTRDWLVARPLVSF